MSVVQNDFKSDAQLCQMLLVCVQNVLYVCRTLRTFGLFTSSVFLRVLDFFILRQVLTHGGREVLS